MSKVVRSASSLEYAPIEHENWWREYVKYTKFNRQGLDIVCAAFEHRNPVGCIVLVTGWNESFLKYSDLIHNLFIHNYSIYTYDHQSQGLSGRWLVEPQSTWVHSFDDYVDDFVYFLTKVARDNLSRQPIFVIAHDMGCLISAIGMSRHPLIVSRAVFTAPLIRNKCGMKSYEYRHPFPQPLAYWIAYLASYCGLGSSHFVGSLKERTVDKIALRLTSDRFVTENFSSCLFLTLSHSSSSLTSTSRKELKQWEDLRFRYPSIISSCITNDWLIHCIRAQNKFSRIYELFRTNTLILQASDDIFVYNRAMNLFARKAPSVRFVSQLSLSFLYS
jgi:lysophospholipase